MAGNRERHEYYWINGRVVMRKGSRPSGYGKWPVSPDKDSLIVAIERVPSGLLIKAGPVRTPRRESIAMLMEEGFFDTSGTSDIGSSIPKKIIDTIKTIVADAEARVTDRFRSLSNEERTTGVLFDRLEGVYDDAGWRVKINYQGYSSAGANAKEHEIGADVGIIFDIASSKERVIKVIWLQAKRADHLPSNIRHLPDLGEQLDKMQSRTKEAYAVIYTPIGVHVVHASDVKQEIGLSNLFEQSLNCTRGDRNPSILADTLDRDHVLEVLVTAPD